MQLLLIFSLERFVILFCRFVATLHVSSVVSANPRRYCCLRHTHLLQDLPGPLPGVSCKFDDKVASPPMMEAIWCSEVGQAHLCPQPTIYLPPHALDKTRNRIFEKGLNIKKNAVLTKAFVCSLAKNLHCTVSISLRIGHPIFNVNQATEPYY